MTSRAHRDRLPPVENTSQARTTLVGAATGATHIQLDAVTLPPRSSMAGVTRLAETALVVLAGTITVEGAGTLSAGGWAHIPIGESLEISNPSDQPAQWVETVCPQLRDSDILPDQRPSPQVVVGASAQHVRAGTVDLTQSLPPAPTPAFAIGNISGATAAAVVSAATGADRLVLLFIEYAPGGSMNPHDHPFEEAYVFVEGEMEGVIDGTSERFGAGDVLWTGVGNVHGFTNVGEVPARWIEVQSPLPPPRFGARFASVWGG